jgi:hypothetical protein
MGNRKISTDLKDTALRLWELRWAEKDIMQGLVVSCASLYHWKRLFEETGSTAKPPTPLRGGPASSPMLFSAPALTFTRRSLMSTWTNCDGISR